MKRTPLTRKKRMARKAKKPTDRETHREERERYRQEVGQCQICRQADGYLTVHHIVTKRKGTYEARQNWLVVCDIKGGPPCRCHAVAHAPGGRQRCIGIKLAQGDWFTREQEMELFGRYYTTEEGKVI